MIAAIEDDNPVLFIEHRWLHHVSDNVPDYYYRVPIGQARTLHEGSDVTVAAFSYMAFEALIAAKSMSMEMGIGLDVIDMRTVRPLDVESVLTSVRKTGRLIVADTAFRTGSIAGELISQVVEQAFSFLKAPPVRIASQTFRPQRLLLWPRIITRALKQLPMQLSTLWVKQKRRMVTGECLRCWFAKDRTMLPIASSPVHFSRACPTKGGIHGK